MLTYTRVLEIVENGRWNNLIGEVEGDSFDGKREVYDLSVDQKKMELAKDASSFANAAGGLIIVGIETKKSALHFSDEVVSLKPFEATHFNLEQYRNILDSWIYPKIGNIKIEWKEEIPGANRGFGIIDVPPQPEEMKPFLIKQTVLDSSKRSHILFGYAERKLDVSEPASIFELHQLLRDGHRYNKLIGIRFDALEAWLGMNERTRQHYPEPFEERQHEPGNRERTRPNYPTDIKTRILDWPAASTAASGGKDKDYLAEIKTRIQEALKVNDLGTRSHFALAAYPSNPTELPNFFSTKPDSIVKKLEKPPITREAGFVVIRSETAKIIAGELWRVDGDYGKVVDLYSDGALIFGCAADNSFLGWGARESQINTLALVEVVYNFYLFYAEVIKEFPQSPDRLHFRFEFGNMHLTDGKPAIYLVPFAMGGFPGVHNAVNPAPKNKGEGEIRIPGEAFDPASAAFKVVEKIYQWFGFTSDLIPYTEEIDGQRIISESQIKSRK